MALLPSGFSVQVWPGYAHRLVPLGFIITSLLLGSLAVEPFLYAALLIEMAVLIAIPLLIPLDQRPGKGVIRFLIFQTLAMPFILMAGFLLSGVEASPSDVNLVIQAGVLLGLGFAFLLAVFPFYTWIPMICEEASPYAAGFVLMIFPTIGILFGLNFLDRYTFLRESRQLYEILRFIGIITFLTAGIWALFQRHGARMMGYASIMATGLSILAMSLPNAATACRVGISAHHPQSAWVGSLVTGIDHPPGNHPFLVVSEISREKREAFRLSARLLSELRCPWQEWFRWQDFPSSIHCGERLAKSPSRWEFGSASGHWGCSLARSGPRPSW